MQSNPNLLLLSYMFPRSVIVHREIIRLKSNNKSVVLDSESTSREFKTADEIAINFPTYIPACFSLFLVRGNSGVSEDRESVWYPSLNRGWRDKKKIGIWRAMGWEGGEFPSYFSPSSYPSASRNEEEEEEEEEPPRQGRDVSDLSRVEKIQFKMAAQI